MRLSAIDHRWKFSRYPDGTTGQQGDIVIWIPEETEQSYEEWYWKWKSKKPY